MYIHVHVFLIMLSCKMNMYMCEYRYMCVYMYINNTDWVHSQNIHMLQSTYWKTTPWKTVMLGPDKPSHPWTMTASTRLLALIVWVYVCTYVHSGLQDARASGGDEWVEEEENGGQTSAQGHVQPSFWQCFQNWEIANLLQLASLHIC